MYCLIHKPGANAIDLKCTFFKAVDTRAVCQYSFSGIGLLCFIFYIKYFPFITHGTNCFYREPCIIARNQRYILRLFRDYRNWFFNRQTVFAKYECFCVEIDPHTIIHSFHAIAVFVRKNVFQREFYVGPYSGCPWKCPVIDCNIHVFHIGNHHSCLLGFSGIPAFERTVPNGNLSCRFQE